MSLRLPSLLQTLNQIAPLALAESWDNVGLLAGDLEMQIDTAMTCLTITKETVAEAIDRNVNLVIVHHPIPFKPINRLSSSTLTGKWMWKLVSNQIAIYSPHTAWDNTIGGINDQLAAILKLDSVQALVPYDRQVARKLPDNNFPLPPLSLAASNIQCLAPDKLGAGRIGRLIHPITSTMKTSIDIDAELTIQTVIDRLQAELSNTVIGCNESREENVSRVAVVCGSGGSFVEAAFAAGADLLVTGEATYHQLLEAQATGLKVLTIGHFASERFAMNRLADWLNILHPECQIFPSSLEKDAIIT